MRCLILAAGRGSRITEAADCKPLLPLAGLRLIERTIATANRAGLDDFCVVTGYNAPALEAFLSDLSLRRNLAIEAIVNKDWKRGDGTSLLCAHDLLDENFLLLMADHVFDESILTRLLCQPLHDGEIILAADRNVTGNDLIDLDDVTKVLAEDGHIIEIGKGIERYNAFDTGIFLCSPAIFAAVEQSARLGDPSVSGGVRHLASKGKARIFDVGDSYWIDVDTPADVKKATSLLYHNLGKPHDGLISRTINRQLSRRVTTPLLLKLSDRVSANHVSVLSFVVAVSAALLFFFKQPLFGGVVVQLASVLDGSDGEIARLKKTESRFGNFFDAVLDRYAEGFILFSMFYFAWSAGANARLFGDAWEPLILGTGMLAIFGAIMVSYTSAKSIADFGYRYRGSWIAAGQGRDLRLFLLFIAGVLAVVHPLSVFLALGAVAILTNAIVLRRIWISWSYEQRLNPFADVRLKAVVFDLDGTIADTMPFLTKLAIELLTKNYGISEGAALQKYRETVGMHFAGQLELIFPGHPQNPQVTAAFEARKLEEVLRHPIFPDAIRTLKFFKERNIKRFICSSTKPEIVSAYAKKYRLDEWADACLGYEPGFGKDRQIDFILQQHDFKPDEVVFVGDSLRDYDFVRGKRIRFIGIRRSLDRRGFQRRGLTSVEDLTALTRLWDQSMRLRQFVENVDAVPALGGQGPSSPVGGGPVSQNDSAPPRADPGEVSVPRGRTGRGAESRLPGFSAAQSSISSRRDAGADTGNPLSPSRRR